MDQENEVAQMKIEAKILASFQKLYDLLRVSDDDLAEDTLGMIAHLKAKWEGDKGSADVPGRMVLQNPAHKDHIIYITIGVKVNYGDAENPDNPYSSEKISETLGDLLKCEVCGNWHWNQGVCGMDTAWLAEIADDGETETN